MRLLPLLLLLAACDKGGDTGSPDCTPSEEICDLRDNDCDGLVDEGLGDTLLDLWPDDDDDGYGDGSRPGLHTCLPPGYARSGDDCDDDRPDVHPEAEERCDLLDNDCNGLIDEGLGEEPLRQYPDVDRDGHGDASAPVDHTCELPGHVLLGDDCDDLHRDALPGGTEVCDGLDNDCDGGTDDIPHWLDLDGDGFGDPDHPLDRCPAIPALAATDNTDCDDLDPSTHPGADELCDGNDRDCDGVLWEGGYDDVVHAFPDADGDGLGELGAPGVWRCEPREGEVPLLALDCDDAVEGVGGVLVEQISSYWNYLYTRPAASSVNTYRYERTDCATAALYTHAQNDGIHRDPFSYYDGLYTPYMPTTIPFSEVRKVYEGEEGETIRRRDYDSDCRLIKEELYLNSDEVEDRITTWTYDDDLGTVTKTVDRGPDGTIDQRTTEAWDDRGNLVLSEEDADGDGLLDSTLVALYDDQDNPLLYEEDEDGDGILETAFQRGYDDGLLVWEERDTDGDGTPDERTDWTWCRDPRADWSRSSAQSILSETLDSDLDGEPDEITWWAPRNDHKLAVFERRDGELVRTRPRDCEGDARQLTCVVNADSTGEPDQLVLTWDDRGNPTGYLLDREHDGTLDSEYRYTWSDDDRLLWMLLAPQSVPLQEDTWTYDPQGRPLSWEQWKESTDSTTWHRTESYYNDGTRRASSEAHFDRSGDLDRRTATWWSETGRPSTQEVYRHGLTLHTRYDDEGRQRTVRIYDQAHDLDRTVDLTDHRGRSGSLELTDWGCLVVRREGSGYGAHDLLLHDSGGDCEGDFHPLQGTTYASGVPRTFGRSYADISDQVGYTLFPNRFLRREYWPVSGELTQVSIATDGVTHTVDHYDTIYSDLHDTTETVWSCE
ncbi:MAG: putative metal-binding motif-containing protein [Deltaproteobacteria bacterium]|nr:putative metal-binding motif-containing protein [Deltaproteobacteria bacterium]